MGRVVQGPAAAQASGLLVGPLRRAVGAWPMLRVWARREMGTRAGTWAKGRSVLVLAPGGDYCSCPGLGPTRSQVSLKDGESGR